MKRKIIFIILLLVFTISIMIIGIVNQYNAEQSDQKLYLKKECNQLLYDLSNHLKKNGYSYLEYLDVTYSFEENLLCIFNYGYNEYFNFCVVEFVQMYIYDNPNNIFNIRNSKINMHFEYDNSDLPPSCYYEFNNFISDSEEEFIYKCGMPIELEITSSNIQNTIIFNPDDVPFEYIEGLEFFGISTVNISFYNSQQNENWYFLNKYPNLKYLFIYINNNHLPQKCELTPKQKEQIIENTPNDCFVMVYYGYDKTSEIVKEQNS